MSFHIRRCAAILPAARRLCTRGSTSHNRPYSSDNNEQHDDIMTALLANVSAPASAANPHVFPSRSTAEDNSSSPPVGPRGTFTPPAPRRPPPVSPFQRGERDGFDSAPRAASLVPAQLFLHAHCTRNNTILTLGDGKGQTQGWVSGGSCGFKGAQRASYEAGYQCAVRIFAKIQEHVAQESRPVLFHIVFKGRGQGREALQKALLSVEGENVRGLVNQLTDRTAIKIGGTRAKKARRL